MLDRPRSREIRRLVEKLRQLFRDRVAVPFFELVENVVRVENRALQEAVFVARGVVEHVSSVRFVGENAADRLPDLPAGVLFVRLVGDPDELLRRRQHHRVDVSSPVVTAARPVVFDKEFKQNVPLPLLRHVKRSLLLIMR